MPQVRTARPDEMEAVIALATLAFSSDPSLRFLLDAPATFLERFPAFGRAFGGAAFEKQSAFVAEDEQAGSDAPVLGAALWLPPGAAADDEAIGRALIGGVRPERLAAAGSSMARVAELHPSGPHWYLAVLAVDPRCQGRGVGSALLTSQLAEVDRQGLPAFLETAQPANLPLYERFGFRVLEVLGGDDTPPLYPMLRDPR